MMFRIESLKDNFFKNKILVENFTFLSVLQISNLVLFIITIPYLFRVLGSQNYGLIVFAQTTAFYFSIFINFGFNLTATRDISVNRADKVKISEIVSSVLTLKLLFFIFSIVIMLILTMVIKELKDHQLLFVFSMFACLSDALFPVWYFQGIEKMKYISFINISARLIATILVFIVIDSPGKYIFYPLLLGIGTVTGAILALFVVFQKHKIPYRLQGFKVLKSYFNENLLYFFSNVSTQIYVNANRIIVGAFLGMVEVAYYDVAEKIVNILKVPYSILGQTLFPKVSRDRNVRFLKKMLLYILIFSATVIAIIYIFSPLIISFFSGTSNENSSNILRILSISLLPIAVSLVYGDLILINFELKTDYAKMRFLGFLFYFISFVGLYLFDFIGVYQISILVVAVEFYMSLYSYVLCKRNNLL